MANTTGNKARVLWDEFNLSQYLKEAKLTIEIASHDVTVMGDSAKKYIPGLTDAKMTLSGLYDGSTNASNDIFKNAIGAAGGNVVSYAPAGFAAGNPVDMLLARQTSYEITSPVEDINNVAVAVQADGGADNGISLHDLTAETAPATGTVQDNTVSSSNGGVGHLHATDFTGTSATIKVKHSADNLTFADLITFTAVTGATKERKTVTGTVNRYVESDISGTFTSCTFALAFARR